MKISDDYILFDKKNRKFQLIDDFFLRLEDILTNASMQF